VTPAPADLRSLIEKCANGEPEAQVAFQEQYGWLIYTLPTRLFRLPAEEAGNFYLYVFERERIFKRARSFQGRNAMQFETYLAYYVLKDLLLDWVRTRERVEEISLDAPLQNPAVLPAQSRTGYDILAADPLAPDTVLIASDEVDKITHAFDQLDDEKRLSLKLLALWTIELTPDDIRCLAYLASRSIRETLDLLEEVKTALAIKADKVQEKRDALHTVAYWIHTYQRRIAALDEHLQMQHSQGATHEMSRLTHDKAELERKLAWRYRQQAKLWEELQRVDICPSYKDIARLLNRPVGTICSRIARAREALEQALTVARDASK
jgi:DNA-directed RNA polymerase specialized sigma24 family protein